mmetsp:Transcript_33687/g.92299  ORF Transcript_33687/g.92299 Transcript_33687/m.92299 type:complete len:170 (-) Transcript_33687:478-987(-)
MVASTPQTLSMAAAASAIAQQTSTLARAAIASAVPDEDPVVLTHPALQLRAQRQRLASLGSARLLLPATSAGNDAAATVKLPPTSVLSAALNGSDVVETLLSTVVSQWRCLSQWRSLIMMELLLDPVRMGARAEEDARRHNTGPTVRCACAAGRGVHFRHDFERAPHTL